MGFERSFGAVRSKKDIRDYRVVSMAARYPETYELTPPPVRNQGSVGSCVAYALSSIAEWHYALDVPFSDDTHMSTMWIYGNRRNTAYKDHGMVMREAIKSVVADGDALYANFPGNKEVPDAISIFEENYKDFCEDAYKHRFTGYAQCNSIDAIKEAIVTYGLVIFSIDWFKDLKYKDGVLDSKERKESTGGHAMFIYGWNEKGWLIQNSWGACWGHKGRAILPFDFPMNEVWAIYDTLDEGHTNIKKPWHAKALGWIAKVINSILNFFLGLIQK